MNENFARLQHNKRINSVNNVFLCRVHLLIVTLHFSPFLSRFLIHRKRFFNNKNNFIFAPITQNDPVDCCDFSLFIYYEVNGRKKKQFFMTFRNSRFHLNVENNSRGHENNCGRWRIFLGWKLTFIGVLCLKKQLKEPAWGKTRFVSCFNVKKLCS